MTLERYVVQRSSGLRRPAPSPVQVVNDRCSIMSCAAHEVVMYLNPAFARAETV